MATAAVMDDGVYSVQELHLTESDIFTMDSAVQLQTVRGTLESVRRMRTDMASVKQYLEYHGSPPVCHDFGSQPYHLVLRNVTHLIISRVRGFLWGPIVDSQGALLGLIGANGSLPNLELFELRSPSVVTIRRCHHETLSYAKFVENCPRLRYLNVSFFTQLEERLSAEEKGIVSVEWPADRQVLSIVFRRGCGPVCLNPCRLITGPNVVVLSDKEERNLAQVESRKQWASSPDWFLTEICDKV